MTRQRPSRRDVLAGVAAAGTAVGLFGATASARSPDSVRSVANADSPSQDEEPLETIELGAEISGFRGVAPDTIADETNPTLTFDEVGGLYRVEWENLDGNGHNFQLRDDDSEVLAETESTSTEGETLSVTFEATTEMVTYVCQPHAASMRGDVEVDGSGTTTGNDETSAGGETTDGDETTEGTTAGGTPSDGGSGGPLPGFGAVAAIGGLGAAVLARLRSAGGTD